MAPATRANAVNDDGSVIVGFRQDQLTGERTAAKWVNGVPELILTDTGDFNGEAQAVSADGNTIVGGGYQFGDPRMDLAKRRRCAPDRHGATMATTKAVSVALGVSDDGKTVIGFARKGINTRAFIWRQGSDASYLDTLRLSTEWSFQKAGL